MNHNRCQALRWETFAFPNPESVREVRTLILLYLKSLLELNPADGMTAPHHLQDFAEACAGSGRKVNFEGPFEQAFR